MYQELLPLQERLAEELRETVAAQVLPGMDPEKLLKAYIGQLTLHIGVDVSNKTLAAVVIDDTGEILDSLVGFANNPQGFERFKGWVEEIRTRHHARIVVVGSECTGVYYEEFWRYLKRCTDYARVLYNARTTEHMGEVLSTRVRDDQIDAYLIAEQLRLGSTPESQPHQDLELLEARSCSRFARDIAKEINRKKNQTKSLIRTFNPAFYRIFPGNKFWSAPAQALLQKYIFPEDFITAGVEQIAAELQAAGRGKLGRPEAQALIEECQACYASPGQRHAVRQRIIDLTEDIARLKKRQKFYLKSGYQLIENRPETPIVRATCGAGISNTLAIVSEIGDAHRFPDGEHLASFLGITTSKHISGTTLFSSKHITKQGSTNARFAVINLSDHLRRKVPKYIAMYERIKNRKPPRKGHYVALVAVGRDFVTNVLYDMLTNHRPFFIEVEDYKRYRQQQQCKAAA
jgi:transposase